MDRKYKILWIDDDFSPSRDDSLTIAKDWMEEHTDLTFTTATNAADMKAFALETFEAIILDVRFPKDLSGDNSKLTAGYFAAAKYIKDCGYKNPIFIVSAEPSVTKKENDTFLNSLEMLNLSPDDIYDKGELIKQKKHYCDIFIEKIKESNSLLFKLRSRHSSAFAAAEQFEQDEVLLSLLSDCEQFKGESDAKHLSDMLSSVRRILEKMMTRLEQKNILPAFLDSPNQMKSLFLNKSDKESNAVLTEEGGALMSQAVATQLGYIIDISNDAHHDKKRLAIHVNDYLRSEPDESFVQAVILMLTSVLHWYDKTCASIVFAEDGKYWTGGLYAKKVKVQKNSFGQYFVECPLPDGSLNKVLIHFTSPESKICKDMDDQVISEGDLINITKKPESKPSKFYDSFTKKYYILKVEE